MKLLLRVVKIIVYLISSGILLQITSGLSYANEKEIFGLHEYIYIANFDVNLKAKLDTGASTSSISAVDIKEFKRDGDDWVSFQLAFDDAPDEIYKLPVTRISKIKRRAGDINSATEKSYSSRPVVELEVTMGNKTEMIEVSLTDRTRFKYPFLVGSKALKKFSAVVDPSMRFTAKKPAAKSSDADSNSENKSLDAKSSPSSN